MAIMTDTGSEEVQMQEITTDHNLETTGQKRKLRSSTLNASPQKKARLDNPTSVTKDPSTTVENPTTPTKRARRAATANKPSPVKAEPIEVPTTCSLPDAGQAQSEGVATINQDTQSSAKKGPERGSPDVNKGQLEGVEGAILVTPLSRQGSTGQRDLASSSQTPSNRNLEAASLSTPSISIRQTRRSLRQAARGLDGVTTQTANSVASSPSRKRGGKGHEPSETTTVNLPSASSSKKRRPKPANKTAEGNVECKDSDQAGPSSMTRGQRNARLIQAKVEGQSVLEGPTLDTPSSPKISGRPKGLFDVNQTPNQEVVKTEDLSLPLSSKKRGRPKKADVTTIKQPKPVQERTKKMPNKPINGVKWRVDAPTQQTMDQEPILSTKQPRIWTQERDDIMAMLPELNGSRCVNGLTWAMYETPMLLLDNTNTFMEVNWKHKDANVFDLVTTRSFVCPVPSDNEVTSFQTQEFKYPLQADEDESKNVDIAQNDRLDTTTAVTAYLPVPQTETAANITVNGQLSGPSMTNAPVILAGPALLHTNDNQSALAQDRTVAGYRVITAAYGLAKELSVKKEEVLYRFENAPIIDEAAADRILDDASRLIGGHTNTSVKDANSMDIIHSPESPTIPLPPAAPFDELKSTSNIPTLSQFTEHVDVPDTRQVSEPAAPVLQDHFASYIPSPIPDELAAIVDAYIAGTPLTLLMSNDRLTADWSLALPKEFGFVMMGYFKILGVQEERLPADDNLQGKRPAAPGNLTGRVRWRITLQWAPGGEKYIFSDPETKSLKSPWWELSSNSDNPALTEQPRSPNPNSQHEPEEGVNTTEKYRTARLEHPNWEFRHYSYDNIYHGLIPKHLLAPFGPQHFDDFFPLGWFCEKCGRLNYQTAMRHRQCKSSFCKDLPPPVDSYVIPLVYLRDPHDRHVIFLPNNSHPGYIQSRREESSTGPITFSYETHAAQNPFLKHIFTSNLSEHQVEATDLLKNIQLNLPLVRTTDTSDPYFSYSTKGKQLQGDLTSPDSKWLDVPECVNTCRRFMSQRLLDFANLQSNQIPIGLLTVISWITTGIKTIPVPISAKKHPVSVLCMGCDVVLNITLPASVASNKSEAAVQELGGHRIVTLNEDNGEEVEFADPSLGWVADDPETMALLKEQRLALPQKRQPKLKVGKKIPKDTFVLTLVHGDMAVFFGETFECSIKRGGTSLLVIATQK